MFHASRRVLNCELLKSFVIDLALRLSKTLQGRKSKKFERKQKLMRFRQVLQHMPDSFTDNISIYSQEFLSLRRSHQEVCVLVL